MEIKHVPEKDYHKALKLDEFAFQSDIPDDIRDKVNEQLKWESIIGVYDGDALAAKLSILPLATYLNGKKYLMGGIGSVATWPEYRRQGMIKKLMKAALDEMRAKGQTISFLHPFAYAFYRKFGWELTFNEKSYTIPMERLRKKWDGKGYVKSFQHDFDTLHTIYTTYAKQFNGMLTREELVWKNWVIKENQQKVIAYNDKGVPEGYIIYNVKKEVLDVKDFAYTSVNGWKLILEFIANHDSMAKKVEIVVPENDQLALLLNEPQMEQKTEAHMMARIVDVHAFLHAYNFHDEKMSAISLRVTDTFLPENNGTYFIQPNGGKTSVTAMKHTDGIETGIQCDVQELTLMLMGFARPQALLEIGRISGPAQEIQKLEMLIPNMQPFLVDAF